MGIPLSMIACQLPKALMHVPFAYFEHISIANAYSVVKPEAGAFNNFLPDIYLGSLGSRLSCVVCCYT